MSDWESDGDDAKPAAPVQSQQRYDQNRGYGNDRRDYGSDQRGGYQQRDNRYDQGRDNRQNFGGGRRDNQQNFGNGRRDDNYRNAGSRDQGGGNAGGGGGGYNRGGGNDFKMEVDSSKVGMIIGKGGSKIREIQDNHNVNVKIGE